MGCSSEADSRDVDTQRGGNANCHSLASPESIAHRASGANRAKRALVSIVIAVVAMLSTFALVGCGIDGLGDSASSASQSTSAAAGSGSSTSAAAGSGSSTGASGASESSSASSNVQVRENGSYTSKGEVAAYIHEFGHLPSNFISKTKARNQGWDSDKGNLDDVCPGKSIGGSKYYNDDGQLPDKSGRTWTECDIDYDGGYRGAERIVFSNDGLIYYTGDHYKTFERLY